MVHMSQLSALATTKITVTNAHSIKQRLDAVADQITRSGEAVSLLGPRAVNAAGQDWVGAAHDVAADNSEATRAAWRKGRWQFLIAVGKELGSDNVGKTPPVARPLA